MLEIEVRRNRRVLIFARMKLIERAFIYKWNTDLVNNAWWVLDFIKIVGGLAGKETYKEESHRVKYGANPT